MKRIRLSPGWPVSTRGRALLVAALAIVTGTFLVTVPLHREWFDLAVYRGAVIHWRGGGQLYEYVVPGTHYGFTYPPFAALCMLPMTLVDWPHAVALSLLLNALAGAAILAMTVGAAVRRQGWSRGYAFAVAGCLFALLEPVRDTISFGQVNLLLLALVLADARLLAAGGGRGRGRLAGIGIGLAAAIKLTPAVFILYLFITRRLRAGLVASAVALGATLFAVWPAPGASRHYWTQAMRDTDRVGALAYVSNQSWQGVLARLADPGEPSRTVWAIGVIALLALWTRRARQAAAAGSELAGFALTGLTACLISPVTWVHHLVWTVPALIVLADSGLRSADAELRRRRLAWAASLYVILCSSVVWLWSWDAAGVDGFLGSNAYVWICLGLLLALPVRVSAHRGRLPEMPGRRTAAKRSATMGACTHATEYPLESRQSALPGSSTPPGSKPAPSASGE